MPDKVDTTLAIERDLNYLVVRTNKMEHFSYKGMWITYNDTFQK